MSKLPERLKKYLPFLIIVITGCVLKFININTNYFWEDEVESILHTSGISDVEYFNMIRADTAINIGYYHNLLRLSKQNRTIGQQITGLFSMPQFAPLHHALLIFWYRLIGDEYVHYKLFSVFIFFLCMPVVFFLAKTLFKSDLAAWITLSIFSVSPLFNMYAQEARYQMLWAFSILLSHLVFIKAINKNSTGWWLLYVFTCIWAMYTSFFSFLFIGGHMMYIFWARKPLFKKFLLFLSIAVLAYLPWFLHLHSYRNEINTNLAWTTNTADLGFLRIMQAMFQGFASIFANFNKFMFDPFLYFYIPDMGLTFEESWASIFSHILLIILICWILVFIFKNYKSEQHKFLISVFLPCALFIVGFDVINKGILSIIWRYQVISHIALILMTGYFFYFKINRQQWVYKILFPVLILTMVISTFTVTHYPKWTGDLFKTEKTVSLISKMKYPLLVIDYGDWYGNGQTFMLCNQLDSKKIDVVKSSGNAAKIRKIAAGKEYSDIVVLHATDSLSEGLYREFTTAVDSVDLGLWDNEFVISGNMK